MEADLTDGISFRWIRPTTPWPRRLSAALSQRKLARSALESFITRLPDDVPGADLRELARTPKMATLAIGAVIQRCVARMPADHAYVNVGVWHGFSLLAGMLGNADKRCVGVDDFSQFGGPRKSFGRRFEAGRGERHTFHDMDYRDYFGTVHEGPIGVYYYDGPHAEEDQHLGLTLAEPFLAPGCLVLVDDTNWRAPRRATQEFLGARSGTFELVLDQTTGGDKHPTWWNGLMVLRGKGAWPACSVD